MNTIKDIPNILIIDDEISMLELLEIMLSNRGYNVSVAISGKKAVSMINENDYDLLLCDIKLGDISGIDVLKAAKKKNHKTIVIMISAYASAETAVEAMNEGAYDYVPKPFNNEELKTTIDTALDLKTAEQEEDSLQEKTNLHFGKIIGNSPKMMQIYKMITQIALTKTNILITGESGTGKELVAHAIHEQSDRSDKPFVVVNCGGIPENLLESELFGYKKGAFTGASEDKKGLFGTADKGTIFLDEIGEMNLPMQVKLLRAIQEKSFKPVGSVTEISVDIRIISATNKKLEEEVVANRFREDLFYRLNVIEIKIPPLRERKADLKDLGQFFLDKYSKEMGKKIEKISSYAIDMLNKYDFPGNIRELENLIERSVALSTTNILLPDSLTLSIHKRRWIEGIQNKRYDLDEVTNGVDLEQILEEIERAYLERAMKIAGGTKTKAAELLGLTQRSIRYRLDKLNFQV